ncbi:hypothetical protein Acor_30390 [Acrocarpospora corrugata]|uniref:Abortive infection protein n=1 Tax=Acrocarpospora corrugata TaxID=35763 RepID=A0A5M3VVZ2_9ACTN|nr:hypothetical protein [Acrocarpospora corrugata]GES00975.1 hypothetical protein Acor_30390 [Acrocarpospora corrugata]
MRAKGINFDTGFADSYARRAGWSTREPFDPTVVEREMRVIREDLHCTAVRITGGDPERLKVAAGYAAAAGLEVWLCPFTCDITADELLAVIADCAEYGEVLRRRGAEVVLVTGSELSLVTDGFLPGATFRDRIPLLTRPERLREVIPLVPGRVNAFLGKAVAVARERFGGRISYSSLPFEQVDWTPFDIIATDAGYRSAATAATYRESVRALVAQGRALGKPVSINEFGCVTHRGAADLGERGDSIIDWGDDGAPTGLTGDPVRDEHEQAAYLREVLDILDAEGVDSAFWYTFARYDLPHRDDPRMDFDLASPGVVKVLEGRRGTTYPDLPWEPKAAFTALADWRP